MAVVERSMLINRPVEDVFQFVADFENYPKWNHSMLECKRTTEGSTYISLNDLESFEAAIGRFPGPVLAVSHDRRFIRQFRGEVWELADGRLLLQRASGR
jgi:uncharacterized protein YndB with AHSA1/START domain